MKADREALMAGIVAAPEDDLPRLVFADWLEEHGESDRATFIRLQCASARRPGYESKAAMSPEEAALQDRHLAEWLGPLDPQFCLAPSSGPPRYFERGLLYWWYCSAGAFVKRAHQRAAARHFPAVGVNRLFLYESTRRVDALAAAPALEWVPSLHWRDARLEDAGFAALAGSPHLLYLSSLCIRKPRCSDAGLAALAGAADLRRLRQLALCEGLWGGKYTAAGVVRVLNSDRLPLLEDLQLSDNQPFRFDSAALLRDPGIARLRRLSLRRTGDVAAVAASPHLTGLAELDLGGNDVDDAAALALADSPYLGNLRRLSLDDMNNGSRQRLSRGAEQRLRKRFGPALTFSYGVLVGS